MQVVATGFLNVQPTDFLFNTRQYCENGLQLTLSKTIPVEAQVHWQVTGADTQDQCVEVLQPATSPFTMARSATQQNVFVKPIKNANCALVFNSVLPGSGSTALTEANLFVNCDNLRATPTPSASPNATATPTPSGSPTPSPGACSPSACSLCNENQCLNLQRGGFCEPVYASEAVFNNSISIEDIGPMRFEPALAFVRAGDTIRWRNNGVQDHQIVFDNGSTLQSGVLRPGDSFETSFA